MEVFWFEFKKSEEKVLPTGTWLGCGVTAYNKEDALNLLKTLIFNNWDAIPIFTVKEKITFDDLEKNHVAPNIGNIMTRGIWFPNLGVG